MTTIYLGIISYIIIILSFVSSLLLFKSSNKRNFSILKEFPYELKVDEWKLNLCSGTILSIGIGMLCVLSLYNFFYSNNYSFIGKSLGVELIITNIFLLGLFVLDMKSYKSHIVLTSLFYVMNFICYTTLGFVAIKNYSINHLWLVLVAFFISFSILVSMFSPLISSWYKLKKEEKKGEEVYTRGKIFILAFLEWINILVYLLIYVLVIIEPFIK
ncbi:MAG: hypothetical protein ACI4U5_02785 [Bacilli bacterium]